MPRAFVAIADGTEESECITVLDILRRGGADAELVSAEADRAVTGSHGIRIEADVTAREADFSVGELLYFPGGKVGSERLAACAPLVSAARRYLADGKRVAAMCAAPAVVLAENGLLDGRTATCYGSFSHRLVGAKFASGPIVTDGNVTTARGMGYAVAMGLELVRLLCGESAALDVKSKIEL